MRTGWQIPLFALALLLPAAAIGQIVIQHTGANDPLSQGFSLVTHGEAALNPVQDQGIDAWSIRDNHLSNTTYYRYQLSSFDANLVQSQGAVFTANMRFLEPGTTRFFLRTGLRSFVFAFQLDENQNITLFQGQTPVYTLENAESIYHEFTLVYDAVDDIATFWINGDVRVSGITGGISSTPAEIVFGNFTSQTHTHWNEVTLTIIPEPGTAALLAGAGALLAVGILRRRGRMGSFQT